MYTQTAEKVQNGTAVPQREPPETMENSFDLEIRELEPTCGAMGEEDT